MKPLLIHTYRYKILNPKLHTLQAVVAAHNLHIHPLILYLYIYIYIYMFVCICYIHVCSVYIYIYIYLYVCMYIHTCMNPLMISTYTHKNLNPKRQTLQAEKKASKEAKQLPYQLGDAQPPHPSTLNSDP